VHLATRALELFCIEYSGDGRLLSASGMGRIYPWRNFRLWLCILYDCAGRLEVAGAREYKVNRLPCNRTGPQALNQNSLQFGDWPGWNNGLLLSFCTVPRISKTHIAPGGRRSFCRELGGYGAFVPTSLPATAG